MKRCKWIDGAHRSTPPVTTPSTRHHKHKQYARAVLETDEFFLKFLEPFKKLKASDEVAAWEKAGALAFEVRRCLSGPNPSTDLTGSRV